MNKNFLLAGASLIAIFTASATVIPLLGEIQQKLALGIDELAIVSLAYFVGSCVALIFFARISNSLGRKKVTLAGLALAFISCIIFYVFSSALEIYIARFLQGLGTGLATSAVMSFVIDSVSEEKRSFAATFNVCGPGVGFLMGSFVSIILIEYTTLNPLLIFVAIALFIAMLMCGVHFLAKETVTINHSTLKANLIPKIEVPPVYRMVVVVASLIFIFCWLVGGFFQAFLPVVVMQNFALESSMIGLIFIVFMIPQTFGGFLVKNFNAQRAFLLTFSAFVVNTIVLFISIYFAWLIPFLICAFLAGGLASAATSSAMSYTVAPTKIEERAGIISAIYLMGYAGAGLPNFALGKVATSLDFNSVVLMYPFVSLTGFVLVMLSFYFGIYRKQLNK